MTYFMIEPFSSPLLAHSVHTHIFILANKYFDACCCLLFNQTLARSYKDKCSTMCVVCAQDRASSIDFKWTNAAAATSGGNEHTKMILLKFKERKKTKCSHRQHQNLVDCRLNKKTTTNLRWKKKLPNKNGSIQNEFQIRHYQCLFPYVWTFFFIYALLNNNTLVHITDKYHNSIAWPDSVSNNEKRKKEQNLNS